jgi:hypothetical protein
LTRYRRSHFHGIASALAAFLLAFCFTLAQDLRASGFLELQAGGGIWASEINRAPVRPLVYTFLAPDFGLSIGWNTGFWNSELRIGAYFATTNNTVMTNGENIPETENTNRNLITRNVTIQFSEYYKFSFFNGVIDLSPGLDVKFAYYDDISSGTEYTNSTTDYMHAFLKVGLKLDVNINHLTVSASYKYPLLGALTDRIMHENRWEDDIAFSLTYYMDRFYFKAGYNRYSLIYANPVLTGSGYRYPSRTMNSIFGAIGIRF